MVKESVIPKTREDIHCISMPKELWLKAKKFAETDGRTISSLIRELIKKLNKQSN